MTVAQLKDQYPLSPLQQGMLFHHLRAPEAGTDIEQILCTLPEELENAFLRQAWERVAQRHSALRTEFRWHEELEPLQVVHPQVQLSWVELDWRGSSTPAEQCLASLLKEDRRLGFDLSKAPLWRLTLIRVGDTLYQLLWTFHHALLDGRSFPMLLEEVFAFYESLRVGQDLELPLTKPYRDYIEWLAKQDTSKADEYWRQQLAGFAAPTPLVVDQPSAGAITVPDRQGDDRVVLDEPTTNALHQFAKDNGLTLNTLVQGAWALLLSRYSGEEDVVYGVVRACRKSSVPGAEDIAGLFINTLPFRVRVPGEELLLAWLKRLRANWMSMRDHEHTPLVQVQKCSGIPAGNQLFDSILMFENYQLEARLKQLGGKWANRSVRLYEQTGYPITVTVYAGRELCLQIEFDRTRFEPPTIARMLKHFQTLLEGMLEGSDQRLRELPMLTDGERHQLLGEWNDTRRDYPATVLLHELFEAQVERTPDSVAVTFDELSLTYRDLNERANRLAHYLQTMGVGPDTLVGVCMERSLELVVALYGVLKAGGAYVPIDPEYPQQRVAFMLQDAAVPVLLTQVRLTDALPSDAGKVVCLDRDWDRIVGESSRNPAVPMKPSSLAYMIYTSGSTGRPKGAMNTHRGICNRLLWMQEQYRLTPTDKVLQKTPFSFDVSVWEFFWPLIVGSQLVVANPGGHRDATYLVRLINRQQITVLHFVPSMLRIFLEEPAVDSCRSLRHVICSGEALSFDLQEEFFSHLSAQLHNLYGPTEAAVDVTHWTCRRDDDRRVVPIGRPVANTQVYILDRCSQPVPIGVPGELYLGGVQVGRGYHNRPELTAERFIVDSFSRVPGARLYRTGDLCRWLSDGTVEYLGRLDFQVKIRGLRVELGEIEAAITACDLVKNCAVVARDNGPGDKQLVAYVVWRPEVSRSVDTLRNGLRKTLPDYMVPAHFVNLAELPLSPNGKLDQRALPQPVNGAPTGPKQTYARPSSEVERKIAEIWEQVLGHQNISRVDNFFDLGGDSLRLMRVRNQLQHAFSKELPIVDMFRCPTVQTLAQYLTTHQNLTRDVQDDSRVAARKAAVNRQFQLRQRARSN